MPRPGVYILRSLKNKRFYIGSTIDIGRRLIEHNQGRVKATKYIRPLELKLFYPCKSLAVARKLERRIKQLKRRDLLERMIKERKIHTCIS